MKTKTIASDLISKERERQIKEEGYTKEHDYQYKGKNDLYLAGLCYKKANQYRVNNEAFTPECWPWDKKYWKPMPDDRVRELVKAGALFKADIEINKRIVSHLLLSNVEDELNRLLEKQEEAK